MRLRLWFLAALTSLVYAVPSASSSAGPAPQWRQASAAQACHYRKMRVEGVVCHVVEIDLSNPHVKLQVVRARDYGTCYRSFGSLVGQTQPIAAITGTFFDTVSGQIICNLVRDGRLLEMGSVGHSLSLGDDNRARFLATAGAYGGGVNWKQSEFAISSGPTLVRQGDIALDPRSEGFRDPGLFRQAARAGIATTFTGKLLLVTVNQGISLDHFADVMQSLGADNALNLDGGSSTALYAGGKIVSRPRRRLTNILVVKVRPPDPLPRRLEIFPEPPGEAEVQQFSSEATSEENDEEPPPPGVIEPGP